MKRNLSENEDCSKDNEKHSEKDVSTSSQELEMLIKSVPQLTEVFDIKKKVGEGTFSSVYLARIKKSGPKHKCVALKHLIPTLQPNKILLELQCLQKFGGRCNVMGLLSCVRQENHTVIVMPFFPNNKFLDFYCDMDLDEVRLYIKNLLDALAFIHSGGIIHRDIKPSNFLYNRKFKKFALVDFGLAQKATLRPSSGQKQTRLSKISTSTIRLDQTVRNVTRNADDISSDKAFVKLSPSTLGGLSRRNSHVQLTVTGEDSTQTDSTYQKCKCIGKPLVCQICLAKPIQAAFRAGTPGYRPPEVLLKHPHQTTVIDVWAAGVIVLSLLSCRYPFFYATDDISSLAEMTTIFGTEAIKNCASKIGKTVVCNPLVPRIQLKALCEKLRHKTSSLNNAKEEDIDSLYDLLNRMLNVDSNLRITATEALQHSFFKT